LAHAGDGAENERADARTRTADPFITSEVLYQLSYVGGERKVYPSRIVTVPAAPSTRTRWPVLIRFVPKPVPTTAGRPYSRETIAACAMIPPMSDTAAPMRLKTGAQLGAVIGQIRISPS